MRLPTKDLLSRIFCPPGRPKRQRRFSETAITEKSRRSLTAFLRLSISLVLKKSLLLAYSAASVKRL